MKYSYSLADSWRSIWLEPRRTLREIVDTNPKYMVIPIAMLAGIVTSLDQASTSSIGDEISLFWILALSIILGPIVGLITLYITSYLVIWTGKWIGGNARIEQIRTVYAWSNVPLLLSLIVWTLQIFIFKEELFTEATPMIDSNFGWIFIILGFGVIEIILGIWGFVIYLVGLSEVQGFSKWKAFFNIILSSLPFIIIGIVIVVAVVLTGLGGSGVWV